MDLIVQMPTNGIRQYQIEMDTKANGVYKSLIIDEKDNEKHWYKKCSDVHYFFMKNPQVEKSYLIVSGKWLSYHVGNKITLFNIKLKCANFR